MNAHRPSAAATSPTPADVVRRNLAVATTILGFAVALSACGSGSDHTAAPGRWAYASAGTSDICPASMPADPRKHFRACTY